MRGLYRWLRLVHLFAGLVLAVAVMIYTLTGITVVYAPWISGAPSRTATTQTPVPASARASGETLRAFVAGAVRSKGRTDGFSAVDAGGLRQRWRWPSGEVQAIVEADTSKLTVIRSQYGAVRTMRNLHVLHGAEGGARFALWRLVLDAVSLAMLVFAVTGVLLWHRSTKDRRLGWVLLAGSWAYAVALIGYLWLG